MLKHTWIFWLILNVCHGDSKFDNFIPKGYFLNLHVDFINEISKGEVKIIVLTTTDQANLVQLDLHPSVEINYKSITVKEMVTESLDQREYSNNVREIRSLDIVTVDRTHFEPTMLRIHLAENVKNSTYYEIYISFYNNLTNSTNQTSLYTRTTIENAQIESNLAIMDLTRSGCSAIFPCFEDIKHKVWYQLTVTCPSTHYALSATPVLFTKRIIRDRYIEFTFERTPPMWSNALAIIVAEKVEIFQINVDEEAVPDSYYRYIGYDIKYDNTYLRYLLQRCENLLIRFPLPILTIVAVPSGANIREINSFGLIIIDSGEYMLKIRNSKDSGEQKEESNLPEDFNVVYNAYRMMERMNKQWLLFMATPITNGTVMDSLTTYLALESARQMTLKMIGWSDSALLMSPYLLWTELSAISYSWNSQPRRLSEDKNILMFNMLRSIYGESLLLTALKSFLHKKQFDSYMDDDIWETLNEIILQKKFGNVVFEGDLPVNLLEMTNSWTRVNRIPLISVYIHYKTGEITVDLEPFVNAYDQYELRNATIDAETFHNKWYVPVDVVVMNKTSSASMIREHRVKTISWVQLPNSVLNTTISSSEYILINPTILGPYVINYDVSNWKMLVKHLPEFPPDVTATLLMHALSLTRIGRLDVEILLDMTDQVTFAYDNFVSVYLIANYVHDYVRSMLYGELLRKYDAYFANSLQSMYNGLVEDGDLAPRVKKFFEKEILCHKDYSTCDLSKDYKNLLVEVKGGSNLTGCNYCLVMKKISHYEWLDLADTIMFKALSQYKGYMRNKALQILACREKNVALQIVLETLFLQSDVLGFNITDSDRQVLISAMSDTYEGCKAMLSFVKTYFIVLRDRLSKETMTEYLVQMINNLKTEKDRKELVSFYLDRSDLLREDEKHMKIAMEKLELELIWYQMNYPKLERWINKRNTIFSAADTLHE